MNKIIIKKILLFLLLLHTTILWSKPDWLPLEKAKEIAQLEKKPILIDFYSDTCYYCKVIEKETYQSSEFNIWKNRFVLSIVDGDNFPEVADEFQIIGYPTIIITDYNGVEIGRIDGYYPKGEILKKIELYYNKKNIYEDLSTNIKKEPDNYFHYFNMAIYLDKAKKYKESEQFMKKALLYLKEDNNYYQNKKNILYNLAVLNTKLKNYKKSYSYWNGLLSWLNKNDFEYPIVTYYRAISLLYGENNSKEELSFIKNRFKQLSLKEKKSILQDLEYCVHHLNPSYEKEYAKKLLFELQQ